MKTQKAYTKVNGKEVEYEFIARSELTDEQRMSLNPVSGDPAARWQSVANQADLEDMDDKVLNAIAKKLGTPKFVYRWKFV